MAIDETAYTRLEEIGRRERRVTTDDMRRLLPIDRMSSADLAGVIERLERAGIEVDVDPVLLRPRGDTGEPNDAGVVDIATYAAPAVSAPGVRPSTPRDLADMGDPHHHHGSRRAPTWDYGGLDLLPIACVALVAIVLIGALG